MENNSKYQVVNHFGVNHEENPELNVVEQAAMHEDGKIHFWSWRGVYEIACFAASDTVAIWHLKANQE